MATYTFGDREKEKILADLQSISPKVESFDSILLIVTASSDLTEKELANVSAYIKNQDFKELI